MPLRLTTKSLAELAGRYQAGKLGTPEAFHQDFGRESRSRGTERTRWQPVRPQVEEKWLMTRKSH